LIKSVYDCKGYNARHFIIEFSDTGCMKNSINTQQAAGEVEKVRNSAMRIFVAPGDAI